MPPATRCRSISTRGRAASCTCGPTARTRASASRSASAGRPAALAGVGTGRRVASPRGRAPIVEYQLVADGPRIDLGWFLLGSMRVERDLQYSERHLAAFAAGRSRLARDRSDARARSSGSTRPTRSRQLALLGAADVEDAARATSAHRHDRHERVGLDGAIVQPSLDATRHHGARAARRSRTASASRAGDSISLRARAGSRVRFSVRVSTTGRTLTPLTREEIFTPAFPRVPRGRPATPAGSGGPRATCGARWLEREVRGVELLVVAREAHGRPARPTRRTSGATCS